MKWILYWFGLLALFRESYAGSPADEMAKTTHFCCNQGTSYARNHTTEDCSSSPIPDVPSSLSSLCIYAMDQCCREYLQEEIEKNKTVVQTTSKAETVTKPKPETTTDLTKPTPSSTKPTEPLPDILPAYRPNIDNNITDPYNEPEPAFPITTEPQKPTLRIEPTRPIKHRHRQTYQTEPYPRATEAMHRPITEPSSTSPKLVDVNIGVETATVQGKMGNDGSVHVDVGDVPKNEWTTINEKPDCERGFKPDSFGECVGFNDYPSYRVPTRTFRLRSICDVGYHFNVYTGQCEDINECSSGEAKCGPIQLCTNLPGGYNCSCPTGFRLIGDHECEDIDECATASGSPACSLNADCINTIGSYQCRCHEGFRLAPINDKVCVDVDECTESRSGSLCQQRCNNVWGGYRCSCHRGYRLNKDNSTCADVDECTEYKSKFLCRGRCVNEPGSYRCTCPSGYRVSEDQKGCIDIDECETGEATCAKADLYGNTSDICFNTRGGYHCHRITCPAGYRLKSTHLSRCEKIETVCAVSDWNCAQQPTIISYHFITFVSNLNIPQSDGALKLFSMLDPTHLNANIMFNLRLVKVDAPPNVKMADLTAFLLTQTSKQGVTSLVKSLEGPQSIELEMSMERYSREMFGGIAIARIYIYISEYEF